MDSSFWFDTINLGWSIVYIERPHYEYSFQIKILFLSLKIVFVNSVDTDDMPHLDFHCLRRFRSHKCANA